MLFRSRRVERYVERFDGRRYELAEERRFVYDDWNLVHEYRYDADEDVETDIEYFWGPDLSGSLQGAGGVGGLVAVSVDGDYYFPGYDNNGNVIGYWHEEGDLVAEYAYDAFGNTISSSGSMASVFPHRFSTKYYDAETDLYYYGYRYYSPSLGRWISRDPIEEEGGINLYQTTSNDMISQVDFLGNRISMLSTTKENTVSIALSVTMQIVFPCSGPALQEKAKAIRDRIKERWTQTATKWGKTFKIGFSKFTAIAVVHKTKSAWRPDYHTFNLVNKDNGFNQDTKLWEVSHVEQVGGSYCEVFKNHHDNFETYVHEFGHMLGLSDLYITRERQDPVSGRWIRRTEPDPHFPNHIMSNGGQFVSAEEMLKLSKQDKTKYNLGLPVSWR